MIAVLAGNHAQFENYLRETGLTRKQARCICHEHDLWGMEFEEYRAVGTWFKHEDTLLQLWGEHQQARVKS